MKAIRVHEFGGPEVLRLDEVPTPDPAAGQVRVRVEAAGVNFIDIYHRTGLYPSTRPFIPGREAAGVVDAVGPGVTELAAGDPVAFAMHPDAYAELVVVPWEKLVRVPDGVDLETAAAIMLQGMTAHYLTHSTYALRPGETALVHAAAGGVGLLLVQVAKRAAGARVIGTVSTREKADLARKAGADHVILYTEQDFEAEVRRLTDGKGVDVVYDSVGADTFLRSLNCLRPRGYIVLYGQSSGPVAAVDPQILNQRGSLFLSRPSLAHYIAGRSELLERAGDLFRWIAAGTLEVRIDRTFPLPEAAEAHRYMEGRKTKGKLLLLP
ncbi:MAG: quinone oxidoreductase [Gemmatimonadetes bacterium]|nr:quinone oxidoreductase [Gemmatimonadota bacterium]